MGTLANTEIVKTHMKIIIAASGSALFAKIKTILTSGSAIRLATA